MLYAQANISIRISPEFSADKAASGLEVVVPMPREVQRVNCDNLKPSQARPDHAAGLVALLAAFSGLPAAHAIACIRCPSYQSRPQPGRHCHCET